MSTEEETKKEETKPEEGEAAPAEAEHHEESTAEFAPVVQLEEVDVKSGEEEEEVLFKKRSKLFIYGETLLDKGTGNKQWRERGVGEMKILKHKEHKKSRLLMRQEKTMKVICNHVIDPRIQLNPNMSSDRSWVWSAFDFSDGELVETIFAIRFSDSDVANEYKKIFEECQEEMKELTAAETEESAESPEAAAAADETAEKLAELKTSD